jgi:hypothetical protein
MAGLFDPSMFPNAMGSNAPQMGLLARLAGMINQPTGMGAGFPPQPPQQQPGADAMASGLIPSQGQPQGPAPAQSAAPMSQMPQGMQGSPQGGGIMDMLSGFLGNHQNALLGLGAGIASGGLQRGVPGMAQGAQQDYQRSMQQNSLMGTYQALQAAGLPEGLARAATLNPELLKTIAPQYMAKPTFGDIGPDPVTGVQQKGWIDTNTRKVTDAAGNPIGAGSSVGGSNAGISPDLQGEDLYNAISANPQLGPSRANTVRGIVEGRIPMPSGTALRVPINQWLANMALQAEPGATAQDFHQRQVTQNDLGKSGNSNLGGILLNGNSAFEHLGTYTDALANLGNHSNDVLPNWEANLENRFKNQVIGNSDTAGKINAANGAALKYGQESTKFYSGTGGGEGERTAALNNNDPASKSGQELAGFAQTERNLMVGRMREAETKIRQNMGDDYLQKHPVFTPDLNAKIARVDANIAKLQGGAPTQATSATQPTTPAANIIRYDAQGNRLK